MQTRPQILLLTHGGWGQSLMTGVRMILGNIDFVNEIALLPEMTFAEYYEMVEVEMTKLPKGSLVMTDVFGGTTTNVAAKLGRDYDIKVYSGLNAPMLIEACAENSFGDKLNMEEILHTGKNSIKDVVVEVLEAMRKEE